VVIDVYIALMTLSLIAMFWAGYLMAEALAVTPHQNLSQSLRWCPSRACIEEDWCGTP